MEGETFKFGDKVAMVYTNEIGVVFDQPDLEKVRVVWPTANIHTNMVALTSEPAADLIKYGGAS